MKGTDLPPEHRTRARYTPLPHALLDDPLFTEVYASDALLAAYIRLRMHADQTWPASAPIPRSIRRAALERLVESGLVVVQPGDRYKMPDVDELRVQQQARASAGGQARADQAERDPGGRFARQQPTSEQPATDQQALVRQPATKRDETTTEETNQSNRPIDMEEERARKIAEYEAKLHDPETPEDVKNAVRFALRQIGGWA